MIRYLSRLLRLAPMIILLGLFGCPSPNTPPASSSGKRLLVIGGISSKTGGAAAYGTDTERGALLALDQLEQEEKDLSIKFVSMDDKSDKNEAVKAATSLININKAQVLFGPTISPSALSVGKLAEESQIPMVATSATQDEITSSPEYDRRYAFRVCFSDSYQGQALARFAVNSLKKKRAAIVFDKTLSYSIGLANNFRQQFSSLGGQVVYEESYSVKDTDYSALIDKVATFDVDVLFIPGWDENVGPMLKQSGDRWRKFTLLGGDGWPTKRLQELSGGNLHNAYAVSHYAPEDPDPRSQAFRQAYQKKYTEEATAYAALGYDAVRLIADAAKRSKDFSGDKLREALQNTSDFAGVTGTNPFRCETQPAKRRNHCCVKAGKDGILRAR